MPDFDKADDFVAGKGMGCELVNQKCKYGTGEFCANVGELGCDL